MNFSVSMRRWRVARVAAVALLGGIPSITAPGLASADDVPRAPDALQAAIHDAWARHPQAAAVQATLESAAARAEASSQPLYNPEFELNADDEGPD